MADKPRRTLVAKRHDLEDYEDVPVSPHTAATDGPGPGRGGSRPPGSSFSFTGKRSALFKIALLNALLTLLTLGIYRFWAKTRIRRYFWSNIRILNEPLEYTGTAMELLIGFLVVLAVLVPVYGLYEGALFLLQNASEPVHVGLNAGYALALLVFFQYAFYRMWRYRFSRTTWRGIRFQQGGSAWKYVAISLGYTIISVVTLGLAFPWLRNAQWKYRIGNLHFGETRFTFKGRPSVLVKKWLVVYVPVITAFILAILYFQDRLQEATLSISAGETVGEKELAEFLRTAVPHLSLTAIGICAFLGLIWFRIQEANFVLNHTQFGRTALQARIKPVSVFGFILLYIVALVVVISGATIVTPFVFSGLASVHPLAALLPTILAGVAALLMLPVLALVILNYGIVRHTCNRLHLINPDDLNNAIQSRKPVQKFGEGLADALDVGAF